LEASITGPIMWSVGCVVELEQAVNDLYTTFTSAVATLAVSIALSTILGIGLGPELSTAIGLKASRLLELLSLCGILQGVHYCLAYTTLSQALV